MTNKCRLVHMDLKGAAFTPDYWQQLIPFLSKMGINGLLMEYEDMFPYNDYLSVINCKEVYSLEQIGAIIETANQYNLRIIPLIQTFGHLEFVLKHKSFKELREVSTYPNSICPTNTKSFLLIQDMIRQMVSLHQKFTKLEAIHIGCDEVWHLGCCAKCIEYLELNSITNKSKLFVDYVSKVSAFVRKDFGINCVIIWDDMMRDYDSKFIIESKLNSLVQPMVWHYLDVNSFRLTDQQFWHKYKQLFPHIWIASAFKGATKIDQMIPPIGYHISNHLAWIRVIEDNQLSEVVEGLALTGWQRFDHFTTLCELFPNSIISLLFCLFAFNEKTFDENIQQKVSDSIGSKQLIATEINKLSHSDFIDGDLYPGAMLYKLCIEWMFLVIDFNNLKNNQSLEGAFTSYQISRNRTNPLHIESFLLKARTLLFRVREQKTKLETEMKKIFFDSTIEEWVETNLNPIIKKLDKIVANADKQLVNHL